MRSLALLQRCAPIVGRPPRLGHAIAGWGRDPARLHSTAVLRQVPRELRVALRAQRSGEEAPPAATTSNGATPTGAQPLASPSSQPMEMECVGVGMEVACSADFNHDGRPDMPAARAAAGGDEGSSASSSGSKDGGDNLDALGNIAGLLLLISPFFFWGSSMVAMKVLGPHTSPLFVGAFRLIPAGAAVIAWAVSRGRPQPSGAMAWLAISVFALFDGAFFQGFLAEGLQRTSAGLGSIIIDSQPISVAILAAAFLGERLRPAGYAGLALGVVGLALLELPPEALTAGLPALQGVLAEAAASSAAGGGGSLWDSGEWWMLLAAQSMALGTVIVPWVSRYVDPVMATGWHLLLGGLPLAALSAATESGQLAERLPNLNAADVALLLYVSLLGSAASYGVFFYEASKGRLTALSSLTFLTPCFAAGLGYALLGEVLTPLQLVGGGVTLAAVTVVNLNHEDAPPKGEEAGGERQA